MVLAALEDGEGLLVRTGSVGLDLGQCKRRVGC